MEKSYREELVGVFGCPVDENPTVVIAQAAFEDLGVPYRYLTLLVKPEDLGAAVQSLHALNMKGINCTIPHKVEVLKYLDVIADDAAVIGAVNTVYVKDGKLYGENTDGKGFISALEENNVEIKGKKVMILGAGGAARAIGVELANNGASHLMIVNRKDSGRGGVLTSLLNEKTAAKAEYIPWEGDIAVPGDVDILVNATNIGLFPDVDQIPDVDLSTLRSDLIVCDVIPNHPHTMLLKEAEKRGAKTIDGLGMLVNQGAIAIKLWTGKEPNREVMKAALRKEYGIE